MRARHKLALAVAVVLTTPQLAATASAPAPAAQSVVASSAVADEGSKGDGSTTVRARKPGFRAKKGVVFSHPLRPKISHIINARVKNAIDHTPKGEQIRLITWNFKSKLYVSALTRAHRRGVSVQVIMSNNLAQLQPANGSYETLKRALSKGNAKRKPAMRSWFRTCKGSCRGRNGIVHSKFFLFSKVGRSNNVVMSSSANLTITAATNQWNDMVTLVGREKVYNNFLEVFKQASHDRLHRPTYKQFTDGYITGWFFPRPGLSDIVLNMLDKVRCRNVGQKAGLRGRTVIRVAQSVFNGKRGARIAAKLKSLHRHGCNIRIVYAVMAGKSRAALTGVPSRHIVQDLDADGYWDRYLHMKAMAISGNYDGDRTGYAVLNGSANWSGTSVQSDEQGLIMRSRGTANKYWRWVDYLFMNPPPHNESGLDEGLLELDRRPVVDDPYAKLDQDFTM